MKVIQEKRRPRSIIYLVKLILNQLEVSAMIFCSKSNGLFPTYYAFLASSQLKLRTSIDSAIALSMFMLSFIFVIVFGLFEWKFFVSFVCVLQLEI